MRNAPGHWLFQTPDRRLTIWLTLVAIAPVAHVSELNIRDARGEFDI